MSNTDAMQGQVAADAAQIYEQFFVPALFGQWTAAMLDAAGVASGDDVLDVGCGTGVLARAAVGRVAPSGTVTGLDRNDAMLAVARRADDRVAWRAGLAEEMPFADSAFDRVTSQFALMFFDDRRAAVAEMSRVLRPGGVLAVATWATIDESPGYAAMVELLRQCIGEAAAEALLAPFCLGTTDDLRATFAGVFPEVEVTRRTGTAQFASLDAWLHTDIRGWTLSGMVDDEAFERLRVAARPALAEFTDERGAVRFPIPALIARSVRSGRD
jgi:ubiquinone/menaquinone biosynthesis C-methylase UbiE